MVKWKFKLENGTEISFEFDLDLSKGQNYLQIFNPLNLYPVVNGKKITINGISFICFFCFEPRIVSETDGILSYRLYQDGLVIEELDVLYSDSEAVFYISKIKSGDEQIRSLIKPVRMLPNPSEVFIGILFGNTFLTANPTIWKDYLIGKGFNNGKLIYIDENGKEFAAKIRAEDENSLTFPCYNDENVLIEKEVKTFMKFKVGSLMNNPGENFTKNGVFPMIESSFKHDLTEMGKFALLQLEQDLLARIRPWIYTLDSNLLAPVVSLCQSSGSGKSKLAFELLKLHLGFYFVFRMNKQTGYPLKNTLSTELYRLISTDYAPTIFHEKTKFTECTTGRIMNFFAKILTRYFKDLIELCRDMPFNSAVECLGSRFANNSNLSDCLIEQDVMDELYKKSSNLAENESIKIEHISLYFRKVCEDPKKAFINGLNTEETQLCSLISSSLHKFPFLFVIDEAEILERIVCSINSEGVVTQNGFEAFRKALSYFKPTTPVLFLTLGTKCDVIDINPNIVDRSMRLRNQLELPQPIILSSNLNIYSKEFPAHKVRPAYEMLLNPLFLKYLATFGHAIWSSLPFGSLITTGKDKIVNGKRESGDYVSVLWMILTGLAANPLSMEAGNAVANHMGYLLHMSQDSKRLIVMYPPEPILALIAHKCIDEIIDDKLFSILERKFEAIDIDHGKAAEIMGGMIILRAIWKSPGLKFPYAFNEYDQFLAHIKEEAPDLNYIWGCETHILEEEIEHQRIQAQIDSYKKQAGIFHFKAREIEEYLAANLESNDELKNIWSTIVELQRELENNHRHKSMIETFGEYKVHSVDSFLKQLLNLDSKVSLSEKFGFPDFVLEGLVNGNQMVNLDSFSDPLSYGNVQFSPERSPIADKRISDKSRFILSEALLRICLVMRLVIKFPPGYYGLDYAVPVLLKNDRCTFIGVQIKRANANLSDDVYKMKAGLHFVKCPLQECPGAGCSKCTENETLKSIYANQISIILSLDEPETYSKFSENVSCFDGCTPEAEEDLMHLLMETCEEDEIIMKTKSPDFLKPLITSRERIKDDILLCKSLWIDKYVNRAVVSMPRNVEFYDDGYFHRQFCIVMRGWNNFRTIFSSFDSSLKIAQRLMNPEGLTRHFPPEIRNDPNFIRKLVSDLSITFPFYSEELRAARGEELFLDKLNEETKKAWRRSAPVPKSEVTESLSVGEKRSDPDEKAPSSTKKLKLIFSGKKN